MPKTSHKTNHSTDKKPANQRGAARLAAVQALYQMDIGEADLQAVLQQFSLRTNEEDVDGDTYLPADTDFLGQIVKGVLKHQRVIDPILQENLSDDWPLTRIDSTLRAVLRASAFELHYRRDIPPKVVISEYVDVANAFFDGEVPGMVNAVLDHISKNLPETPDKKN